jgi:hypothetical protein
MPIDGLHEMLSDPPREPDSPFELAARRMIDAWLTAGRVDASHDDLRLAAAFLRPLGVTLEPLPGREVRMVCERHDAVVLSREAAVVTAIRRLVAFEAERGARRAIARAA